jgi:hypothetical protein
MSLIFDTGPLVALYDRSDANHQRSRLLLRTTTETRLIPTPTLPEVDYWLSTRVGPDAFVRFLHDIRAGAYRLVDLEPPFTTGSPKSASPTETLMSVRRCRCAGVAGFRNKVATFDHRHFRMMRPRHVISLSPRE